MQLHFLIFVWKVHASTYLIFVNKSLRLLGLRYSTLIIILSQLWINDIYHFINLLQEYRYHNGTSRLSGPAFPTLIKRSDFFLGETTSDAEIEYVENISKSYFGNPYFLIPKRIVLQNVNNVRPSYLIYFKHNM